MLKLPALGDIGLLLAFIVPGFVTYQGVRLFSVRIARGNRDFILVYVTLSALNFAVASLLVPVIHAAGLDLSNQLLTLAGYVFVVPFVTGIVLGTLIQKDILIGLFRRRPFRWTGIKPVSHIPTAWDWKFGQTDEQFVLITLKDGTEFTGHLGSASFISSETSERDMFVQQLYERDDEGVWQPTEKSLYVSKDEIRTVEFWPAADFAERA